MKILLTAFEPFGGEKINPAQEAVKLVKNNINGAEIVKIDVPVTFGEAGKVVHDAMVKENPDVVLCIGQAGGRVGITPEKVAINVEDGRIPDNAGYQPIDLACFDDGETAYFTQLPVKKMVAKIKEAGIPASVSYTAGTYVCNFLMYNVLYYIDKEFKNVKGGFMHVPFVHEQVLTKPNTPSLSLNDVVTGIEKAIEAIVEG